eukprot:353674-Chlamydomonas_euryale.AAC.9
MARRIQRGCRNGDADLQYRLAGSKKSVKSFSHLIAAAARNSIGLCWRARPLFNFLLILLQPK